MAAERIIVCAVQTDVDPVADVLGANAHLPARNNDETEPRIPEVMDDHPANMATLPEMTSAATVADITVADDSMPESRSGPLDGASIHNVQVGILAFSSKMTGIKGWL